MNHFGCPDEDELKAYARGELNLVIRAMLESHFRECFSCKETAHAFGMEQLELLQFDKDTVSTMFFTHVL